MRNSGGTSSGNSVGLKTSNVKLPTAAEEVTDEKLAGQLVQTALALLQLNPLPAVAAVPTPAQVEVLLQPLKLLLPAACISEAQAARLRRAQSRSFAFDTLTGMSLLSFSISISLFRYLL
jgi:hypothetical protein